MAASTYGGPAEPIPADAHASTTPAVRPRERDGTVLSVGTVLSARYLLVRHIASGGMGAVYEVEDQTLRDHVALKTVHRHVIDDDSSLERFRREIQLARKITHPHVCRIFDVGFHRLAEGGALPFLTMELLAGETLSERLRRTGPIGQEEALPLVEQLAAGLKAAHEAGIIHRDLKGQNIMLVPRSGGCRVVITDFGLAKATQPEMDDPDAAALTRSGAILGTPAYMAPEQLAGGSVDERTDIYALGVVLFEMLTGRLPFGGGTTVETAPLRATGTRPMPAVSPGLDPRWNTVIERCLARDPEARFPTVAEFVRALHGEDRARPPRRRGRLLALALVGVAGGAAAFVAEQRREQVRLPTAVADVVPVRAPKRLPPPTGTPYERGIEHLRRWEGVAGRAALEDAVAAAPRDARARYALCQALRMTGDEARALTEARAGLALPDVPAKTRRLLEACVLTARPHDTDPRQRIADLTQAAKLYGQTFAEEPTVEIGLLMAFSQMYAGDTTGLEATVTALRALPGAQAFDPRIDMLEAEPRAERGDLAGARNLVERAAMHAEAAGLPMVQARALAWEGDFLMTLGELPAAKERLEQARLISIENGERVLVVAVLDSLSAVLLFLGEYTYQAKIAEGSIELARQLGSQNRAANMMQNVALAHCFLGDHEAGRRELDEATRLGAKDATWLAWDVPVRGLERRHAGDARGALSIFSKPLPPGHIISQRLSTDPMFLAMYEWWHGDALLLAGDFASARRSLQTAVDTGSRSDVRGFVECARVSLAETTLAEGNLVDAETFARHAITQLDRMGIRDCRIRARVVLARALRAQGKPDAAHAVLTETAAISPATEDVALRWELGVALAEDQSARGEPNAAQTRLEGILTEAHGFKMDEAALAASVTLGELELFDPRTAAQGRARLRKAARQAGSLGQQPMERRATAALHAAPR